MERGDYPLLSLPTMLFAGDYKSKSEINKIYERLRMRQKYVFQYSENIRRFNTERSKR